METDKRTILKIAKDVGWSIFGIICGAILGVILMTALRAIWVCLFDPYSDSIFSSLFTTIFEVIEGKVWIPLGTLLGALVVVYGQYKVKLISRTGLYCAGVFLVIPVTLFVGWKSNVHFNPNKTAIAARYIKLGQSCRRGEYDVAYAFMSPEYRATHTLGQFKSGFLFYAANYHNWRLTPAHSIRLSEDRACLYPDESAFTSWWWWGPELELVKVDGEWYFTGRYVWYIDGLPKYIDGVGVMPDICPPRW